MVAVLIVFLLIVGIAAFVTLFAYVFITAYESYLSKHPGQTQAALLAAAQALLKYIQDNPVEDKQLLALLEALIQMSGVPIPVGLS